MLYLLTYMGLLDLASEHCDDLSQVNFDSIWRGGNYGFVGWEADNFKEEDEEDQVQILSSQHSIGNERDKKELSTRTCKKELQIWE